MVKCERRAALRAVAAGRLAVCARTDVMPVDATDPLAIQQHLDEVVKRHGPVSLMFNAVSRDDAQGQVLSDMPFNSIFAPVRPGLTAWFHTGTARANHMARH